MSGQNFISHLSERRDGNCSILKSWIKRHGDTEKTIFQPLEIWSSKWLSEGLVDDVIWFLFAAVQDPEYTCLQVCIFFDTDKDAMEAELVELLDVLSWHGFTPHEYDYEIDEYDPEEKMGLVILFLSLFSKEELELAVN